MQTTPTSVTVFAETNFRNQRRKFGIKIDDRRRHMYVVGKTGMGKSTLLENMIVADIRAGCGVAVVDPHGDLAEKILQFIPNERVNDVIYFNPSDTHFPIAFNILETIGPDYKHLVAYGLVGVFKKIWADSWGPRMEYIMTNTILALLDYPGSTLLGMMRMLVDKGYRKKVVAKITDPVVKTFWADEFANYSEKFRTEAIAPIQNKVGQFLSSAIIRNIVGQSKSTIEMRKIMDDRKILIMNLAKGRIGEENSALLGAMMITKLQIAAMSRVDIPEEERRDFYLYVDEFQNFATDSFAGILSEARKYRLCLIMAHQYFEQLNDVVKAAVFGNVGTLIIFRVGATDAAELELEFAPQFLPTDIVNLKKYTFCMRLMVDGVATEPFSAIGLPPVAGATNNLDKVIRVSRERYARPQEQVEERIIRWSGVEVARPNAPGQPAEAATDLLGDEDEYSEADATVVEAPVEAEVDTTETEAADAAVTATGAQGESKQTRLGKSNEAELASRLRVDAASMIPDDGLGMRQATAATVTAAQPTVVLQPTPVAPQPTPVQPAAVTQLQPEAHTAAQTTDETVAARRPKIDFVQVPFEPDSAESSAAESSVATDTVPTNDDDDFEDENGDDGDSGDDNDGSTAAVAVSAVPEPIRPAAPTQPSRPPAPATQSSNSQVQPSVSGSNPASPSQPTAPTQSNPSAQRPPVSVSTPTIPNAGAISLRDLQAGTAPQVSFKGGAQPRQSNQPNQFNQPSQSGGEAANSENRKRKRKRKRRPGQGGNGGGSSGGFNGGGQAGVPVGQGPRPQQQPAQSQGSRPPASNQAVVTSAAKADFLPPLPQPSAPKPAAVQPSQQPQPAAQPVQPVQPKPTAQPDANKVSLSNLI